ncbi:MAG: hypothetical protein KC502_05890 [Myxococcales bacterium]|nr:hypothetical protein [Myxococcales bacterium]
MKRLSVMAVVLCLPSVVLAQPTPQPMPMPAPQPSAQPAPQPATQPPAQPAAQPATQPAAQPAAQPAKQPALAVAPTTQMGRQIRKQNNKHGLGVSLGMSSGSGVAYRHYMGNTMLQASVFATVTDRGDSAVLWFGAQFARYLLVWHERRRTSVLPSTSALRLVGGASYLYASSKEVQRQNVKLDPNCQGVVGQNCPSEFKDVTTKDQTHRASVGAGIGFEFGAIMRPGFSVALDLQLTALFDGGKFDELWPLPSAALMYSW